MKIFNVTALLGLCLSSLAQAGNPLHGIPPSVSRVHRALNADQCKNDVSGSNETYDLGSDVRLYIIPCFNGAYQNVSKAYLKNAHNLSVTPVNVLAYDESVSAIVSTTDLVSAVWDAKSKSLASFAKSRAVGDCGQNSLTRIAVDVSGNFSIKTTELHSKVACDGRLSGFPVIFKQN